MERRLMPVNALIGLCTPGDVYPAPFADAGYHVSGIEVPVAAGSGKVVIDVVLFRPDRNVILAAEAKSGANVDKRQARGYGGLVPDDVVIAAAITLREAGHRELQALYVCLAENLDRVLLGLGEAGLACPVLAISDDRVEHHGAAFVDPHLRVAFNDPIPLVAPPPRFIVVDDESADDAFDVLVLPALVATLSHRRQHISIPTLAEQAIQHLTIFGKAARNRLVSKVDAAARRAADKDPASFEYLGRTGTRDHAVIRFVRSPEEAARQGRTQVYQSIARAAGKPRRRAPGPDQMALFDDLIEELEQAGGVTDPNEATDEEERQ